MSDDLVKLSATKLAALIRAREVSPVEVIEAHLCRIEKFNPALNAIVTLNQNVLDLARGAQASIMRGGEERPLLGLPFTVKDTIETEGLRTTSGSRLRATNVPEKDAPAVERLKRAGAIILGKTNVPEMAIPYECDNPLFGRTNNPYDLKRTSGGSSGGEAAAISACLSPVGLGSDLSGSIRAPAHFCGIVGLKPTTGRVPQAGHFPPVVGAISEGAVLGPMARTIEDLALLFDILAGVKESKREGSRVDLRGCRVAIYLDEKAMPVTDETEKAVYAALQALCEARLVTVEEKPPVIEKAIDLWPALFLHESRIELRKVYAGQEEKAGAIVRRLLATDEGIVQSSPVASANAWSERDALRDELVNWMSKTPLIIAPVGSVPAFEHGARRVNVNRESVSVFRAFGYSRAANVLGFPSVTLPAGRTDSGLPIGIQIIGRPFDEKRVLAAAKIIEEALGGWTKPPDRID